MRKLLLLLLFTSAAFCQRYDASRVVGSVSNAQRVGGKPVCTTPGQGNCIPSLDASGNLPIGDTVLTDGQQIDVKCSGDVTASLDAALATGGTIRLSAGSCFHTGQLVIPNNGIAAPLPLQKPITLLGAGPTFSPLNAWQRAAAFVPYGGTTLDIRYSGANGRIYAAGEGKLEIGNLNLIASSADTTAFVQTSGTTPYIHDVLFQDVSTKAGIAGTTDKTAIYLSGSIGGVVERCVFDRIKTGVYLTGGSNSNLISQNYFTTNSGSDATGAAFILDRLAGYAVFGNSITRNSIQMNHYVYGVMLNNSSLNTLDRNVFQDSLEGAQVVVLAWIKFDATSVNNLVTMGNSGGCDWVSDDNGSNPVLTAYGSGLGVCVAKVGATALQVDSSGGIGISAAETTGAAIKGTAAAGKGVYGYSTAAGNGVEGFSVSGKGVVGAADTTGGYGLYGSAAQGGTGVYGYTTTGHGAEGAASGTNGIAGYFNAWGTGGVGLKVAAGSAVFTPLAGTGQSFACLDATGKLVRSDTACR